eukprot:CAMPEP_0114441180 /NCGR_PEP_ID=MMETSP0103-20121206/16218_1 /TAXON_ID=37642 ORGANISM="Paraphysomonas imperforata, Strain PA2" /NCGR_SAMPLE_ID=MMETSP0103 /ASSEMBLY_ACC=CAM_ASM_000201 /LENGTH=45 /DNA_ID= /DNA_START= /DNA_END= /DNA_ORIENTATION=
MTIISSSMTTHPRTTQGPDERHVCCEGRKVLGEGDRAGGESAQRW